MEDSFTILSDLSFLCFGKVLYKKKYGPPWTIKKAQLEKSKKSIRSNSFFKTKQKVEFHHYYYTQSLQFLTNLSSDVVAGLGAIWVDKANKAYIVVRKNGG